MVIMQTIYESFTPENTHQMRDQMLYTILKSIRRMLKHKLISQSVYDKFKLSIGQPSKTDESPADDQKDAQPKIECQSAELKSFISQTKRNNKLLNPEYLRFDSLMESGNLDRVEAYPINQSLQFQMKASKELAI